MKKFLDFDKKWDFILKDLNTIKISIKNFENDQKFVEYLLNLWKTKNRKIKLKKFKS
jgi:hypothetical protein